MRKSYKKIALGLIIAFLVVSFSDQGYRLALKKKTESQAEKVRGEAGKRHCPNPVTGLMHADDTQVQQEEAGQAVQPGAGPTSGVSGSQPEGIPDEKERNDMLDRVNRGGPVAPGCTKEGGNGPAGPESHVEGN